MAVRPEDIDVIPADAPMGPDNSLGDGESLAQAETSQTHPEDAVELTGA